MTDIKWPWLCALAVAAILTGCAGQPTSSTTDHPTAITASRPARPLRQHLEETAAMQDRLVRVAAPLLLKNPAACKKLSRPLMGFTARNKYAFGPEHADLAAQVLQLNDMLQVAKVMKGSGAAKSGLQRGDELLAIGDTPMPQGPTAEQDAPRVLAPFLADADEPISLTVQRAGKTRTLSIHPTPACAFRIELGNADNVNSYADGQRVMITRGMIDFVQSDTELAYVIAREMAHNALRHPARLKQAGIASEIINALKPLLPQSGAEDQTRDLTPVPKEMDALADRLALHLLKRAGYDIRQAGAFWQRLAQRYPQHIATAHTALHPETAYRLAAIEKTIAAIAARERTPKSSPKQVVRKKSRRR